MPDLLVDEKEIGAVLRSYGLSAKEGEIIPFGTGLINRTWKVTSAGTMYILQKINDGVFRQPRDIAHNLRVIAAHLQQIGSNYFFVAPLPDQNGNDLLYREESGYFRLLPFVQDSICHTVVETVEQAYEAAKQFGRFTKVLSGVDLGLLRETIPHFHDLELRHQQFLSAIKEGEEDRIKTASTQIESLLRYAYLVGEYVQCKTDPAFHLRVTHHDTKISNVLFDAGGKGLCVIDLDTVMPGHFISDVGDMMRTYLSPVNEEERDLSRVVVRDDYYKAIVEGYLSEMGEALSREERSHFFFAGQFLIYMQALRFMTDYLLGDPYYGAAYPEQNLARACNQLRLLEELTGKEAALKGLSA